MEEYNYSYNYAQSKAGTGKIIPFIPWLIFFGSYAFFLFTLVDNFSASHDSINYLNGISKGVNLLHPHHLLYHELCYYWVKIIGRIMPGAPEYYIAEAFTALWGSAALTVIYFIYSNRFRLRPLYSLAGIAVIAFSYGVWFYSVNIEVYMPPIFFILLCIYQLSSPSISTATIVLVAIFHSFAVLFHQVHILFGFVIVFYLIRQLQIPKTKPLVAYFAITLLLIGIGYFYAGWVIEEHRTWQSFSSWFLGYTRGHDYWEPFSLTSFLKAFTGFAHAIIGGHFIFPLADFDTTLGNLFADHNLQDERYLVKDLSSTIAIVLSVFTLFLAAITIYLLYRFILKFKSVYVRYPVMVQILLSCLVVYSMFFLFWVPDNLEFWILQVVCFWLLLIGASNAAINTEKGIRKYFFHFIAFLLLAINYTGSMHWLAKSENDWYYQLVVPVRGITRNNDLILAEKPWILNDYFRYFTNASVIDPYANLSETEILAKADQSLENGGKVYIYPASPPIFDLKKLNERFQGKVRIFQQDPLIWIIE